MQKNLPQILSVKTVTQSRLYLIEDVHLRYTNGQERNHERLISRQPQAVMVVPLLDENTLLLIREYAVGVERYELAFPGGVIDPGEEILVAANREMKEEIGYGAKQLQMLKTTTTVPGYQNMQVHIVLAQDLYKERLEGDEAEELEVVPWRLDRVDELLAREDFTGARNIAALFLAKDYLIKSKDKEIQ
jgi:ADP-ribose diphosphatase